MRPGIAKQVLKDLQGLVVIDEFQRQPELLPLLGVLADGIEALPLRGCIQVALSELSI